MPWSFIDHARRRALHLPRCTRPTGGDTTSRRRTSMRGTTRTVAVAAMSAVALLAAGCGSGDGDDTATSAAGGQTGGEITVRGCNPENPLVPANTGETCGGDIIDATTAKLVSYDPDTAAPNNDIAESIETTDNENFTVKLKQGYKFHDGTEVKAKNFVDAWN